MIATYLNSDIANINLAIRDIKKQKQEMEVFLLNKKIDVENVDFFINKNNELDFLKRRTVIEMLELLSKFEEKTIYMYSLDVINHDVMYSLMIVNELKNMGIKVIFKKEFKIAGYVRVSSQKQAKDGVSLDAQKNEIYTKFKRMEIVNNYNDISFYEDDGYSGKSLQRPQIKKLIDDMKNDEIAIIGFYDLSRLSRDISDSNWFFQYSKKKNVVLTAVYDDLKYETASDRLNTNIKASFNMYEREKTVERTNDGLKHICFNLKRFPLGGILRFGYYRGEDKNIYINEKEAELFKEAVNMAKNRRNLSEIVNFLNNSQEDKHFTMRNVQEMLKDDKYAGILNYKGKIHYDIIPSIVSIEDLNEARKLLKKNKKKDTQSYYFDSIVFCACGNKMTCTQGNSKGQKYLYYRCKVCSSQISQKTLEQSIINLKITHDNTKEKNKLNKQLIQLNDKIEELKYKYLNNECNMEEYCLCAKVLEDEKAKIEKDLRLSYKIHSITSYEEMITPEEKKYFINKYIKQIIVNPKSKKIIDIILVK